MTGEYGRGRHGDIHYYYKCSTRRRTPGSCTKATERKEELEDYVVNQTLSYVLDPDNLSVIASAIADAYNK